MSYELYRNDVYCKALESFDKETVNKFMYFMDIVAERFDFEKKNTDLIVYGGVPEDLVKAYIASKVVANITIGTIKNYYSAIKNMFECVQTPIEKITSNVIRLWLNYLQHTKGNSPSTADGKRVIVKDFFQWCMEEKVIDNNPCLHVSPIKYSDNVREPIPNIELEELRESCINEREKMLFEFLFSTGCRASEVAAMKIKDIDIEDHTAIVRHGKGDKKRTVMLNAKAITAIKRYLVTRNDNCEYLFVNIRGKVKHGISRKTIENEVARIVKRSGVELHITPHNFRHTTGSYASKAGMPIEEIQEMLGHASIKTTRRYIKVNNESVKHHHWQYMQ